MSKHRARAALLRAVAPVVFVGVAACGGGDKPSSVPAATTTTLSSQAQLLQPKAAELTDLVGRQDWKTLRTSFDANMTTVLTENRLALTWTALTRQYGGYKSRGEPKLVPDQPPNVTVFDVPITLERAPFKTRIAFNNDATVAGLFFLPATTP